MKILVLLVFVSAVYASDEYFKGWKSYYVEPSSPKQIQEIHLMAETFHVDFLGNPTVHTKGVALVRPEYQELFTKALDDFGIKYGLHCDDINSALEADTEKITLKERSNLARHPGRSLPYDNFQPVGVMDQYLIDIARQYPDRVTLVQPGLSFESHPLYYLKISTSNFDGSKPVIIIDGGVHAREWISPPTVTWAIHKLVENVTEPDLLENFDWILYPMVNPDGYSFSYSATANRFWRKTRSNDTNPLSYLCPGVDVNRNFGFEWMVAGSSSNPCSLSYAGDRPFSEVETRVLRDILHEHRDNTAMYLTMHSYGSYILYPWGHNSSLSSHAFALHTVGVAMADAINSVTSFPRYIVGNSAIALNYEASGASEDYAHSIGIPLTFTYELPGFSFGNNGFVVNPSLIEPIVEETWTGIVAGVRQVAQSRRR